MSGDGCNQQDYSGCVEGRSPTFIILVLRRSRYLYFSGLMRNRSGNPSHFEILENGVSGEWVQTLPL
jgi:hypothetical protein